MEEEMDTFDFVLALDLGRTIAELSEMPVREYIAWKAYYKVRAVHAELEKG